MCAIIGALVWGGLFGNMPRVNANLNEIFTRSIERGRDGRGWFIRTKRDGVVHERLVAIPERNIEWGKHVDFFDDEDSKCILIGNLRAEPTTEYVADKSWEDQQPYTAGRWTIVHNGTIANDHDLRVGSIRTSVDSAAIAEHLSMFDDIWSHTESEVASMFSRAIKDLVGSYAILAVHADHPGMIMAACNYRPIWYVRTLHGVFFASSRDYLDIGEGTPQMLPPYSAWSFTRDDTVCLDQQTAKSTRALVVCSGGLDSVVSACIAKAMGIEIELVHFRYGSRAEGPEVAAVKDVAKHLGVGLTIFELPIYSPTDSPLLRSDSTIAGGEEGAEYAHEWVPARNLVMLSVATAMAEARGFDTIVLGNNLEEAGAYPDNEPEFIQRFNDLLPFAVGDGKRVRVAMPVGNLMKHEIVEMGLGLNAPLHLTWSCYRSGVQHCGTCGPCFMRRTAFKINKADEVITYACDRV